jgi:hypothetical protein
LNCLRRKIFWGIFAVLLVAVPGVGGFVLMNAYCEAALAKLLPDSIKPTLAEWKIYGRNRRTCAAIISPVNSVAISWKDGAALRGFYGWGYMQSDGRIIGHGEWTVWGPDLIIFHFTFGRIDGKMTAFRWVKAANGKNSVAESRVRYFRNDVQIGKDVSYYNSGRKYSEENYVNGKLHGNRRVWGEDGSAIRDEWHYLGKNVTEKEFRSRPVVSEDVKVNTDCEWWVGKN